MPDTRTLLQIRTDVRRYADMENSSYVSDAEIDRLINLGVRALWGEQARLDIDRPVQRTEIATTSGTREYALPSDFVAVRLVEVLQGTGSEEAYPIRAYNLSEGHTTNTGLWGSTYIDGEHLRYAIFGQGMDGSESRIRFDPDPEGRVFRLWYLANPGTLTSDTDTYDGVIGGEEYVALWAAEQLLIKEESDPSMLIRRRLEYMETLKTILASRDMGSAHHVARTRSRRRRHGLRAR